MNYHIVAITETTTRDFKPIDDKEYDRIIRGLTRDERYTVIADADTRDDMTLFPIRSAILTKRTRNAKRDDLQ